MEALVTLVIGVLTACGVYLVLRARAELGNDHVDGRD
jgi:multisubunit Na+/H+ antiporter MnhC subunit